MVGKASGDTPGNGSQAANGNGNYHELAADHWVDLPGTDPGVPGGMPPAPGGGNRPLNGPAHPERLSLKLAMLDSILAATNNGVIIVSPQNDYMFFNDRFLEMWGLDEATLRQGREATRSALLSKVINPDEFVQRILHFDTHRYKFHTDEVHFKDGRVFERYSRPVVSDGGHDFGRIWFFYDISDQVAARRAAEEAQQQLAAAAVLRDKLINMIVHDLRNPLGSVTMALELLGDPPDPTAVDSGTLQLIRRQARHGLELCEELLAIKRIEAGQFIPTLTRGSVLAGIEASTDAVCLLAEAKELQLALSCSELEWTTDHSLLRRMVMNLLGNAIKYSPHGSTVEIEVIHGEDTLKISVRDHGPGIASEHHGKVFELYGVAEIRMDVPGIGIGLAFCRMAAGALGGGISIDSTPGLGSCFTITLPDGE